MFAVKSHSATKNDITLYSLHGKNSTQNMKELYKSYKNEEEFFNK